MKDVDESIEQYRKQLVAEAELADSDLDEIEDHLRALTGELRERGMPTAEAVTEAARRLGDPKRIAREHVRVRTAFGAHLSPARAWSALLLIAPMMILSVIQALQYGQSRTTSEAAAGFLLAIGLVTRVSWTRPILFGGFAFFLIPSAFAFVNYGLSPLLLVWNIGVLAFVAPWRRGELTAAGWNLALQAWSYSAASFALLFQFTMADGEISIVMPLSVVALFSSILAIGGSVLRAKWSAVPAAISSLSLLAALIQAFGMNFRFDQPNVMMIYVIGMVTTGAIAAGIGTLLAWRTARSPLGNLKFLR